MATATIPRSVEALDAAIDYHRNCLQCLLDTREVILTFNPDLSRRKYKGWALRDAIGDYLTERGGSATRDELLEGLMRDGAELKSRPRATLSVTITQNAGMFHAEGSMVHLIGYQHKMVA